MEYFLKIEDYKVVAPNLAVGYIHTGTNRLQITFDTRRVIYGHDMQCTARHVLSGATVEQGRYPDKLITYIQNDMTRRIGIKLAEGARDNRSLIITEHRPPRTVLGDVTYEGKLRAIVIVNK